jgi:hypothetical protein
VDNKHFLPSKVLTYLRRLELEFERANKAILLQIIRSCRVYVREETDYDNWNGGTYGHDAVLFLPEDVMKKVSLASQAALQEEILTALNECAKGVNNEHFRAVQFEMADERDTEFQRAVPLSSRPQTDPDTLAIWKPRRLRLFITHRDEYKRQANSLARALEDYGISAFVAHDTIGAMEDWKKEILKGLETMEVMLAFLTDDFDRSTFCNQEIGYALGRRVPIIPLKLQKADPPGFINSDQALRGSIDHAADSAPEVYKLLVEKLGQRTRLQPLLIELFTKSSSWAEANARFDRLDQHVNRLTDEEENIIVEAFNSNNQLYDSFYLNRGRMVAFMNRVTDRQYRLASGKLSTRPVKAKVSEDEIPF